MRARWLHTVVLAVAVSCLAGCFNKRDPEPPESASDFSPPNQPEVVLSNLAAAVTKLNVANFERCFVPNGYVFNPDPSVAQNNVGLFSNWALQPTELDVIRNIDRMKDGTALNRLTYSNGRTNNITIDSVEYTADYRLQIQHKDTTFPQYIFTGNLIFSMRRNADNEYRIARWRDTKTGTAPCWTELKQHFATR
jgi:hypothetical protein